MISFLNGYTTKILYLSIFICVLQLIIPQGKLRQNVLFVSLIVVTLAIIEPLLNIFNNKIDVSKIYEINEAEYISKINYDDVNTEYNNKIMTEYKNNLQNDIVERLKEAGYVVRNIECELDENTYEPKSLKIQVESISGVVQQVRINVMSNNEDIKLSAFDKSKICSIVKNNYGISKENIEIE